MQENDITVGQIRQMKHAIGFSADKVTRKRYVTWRNYFCVYEKSEEWEKLVSLGLAVCNVRKDENQTYYYYSVTKPGLGFLGKLMGIKIVEGD